MGEVPADPWRAIGDVLLGVDGLAQVERVRRGLTVHATTPRPPVGQTPHEVVHIQDKLELRHYAPAQGRDARGGYDRPPVILVPSLINRAYILDLEPGRSLVAALAELGHPVYLVDWGVPGPEDAGEDVGYVLLELLHRCVDRACRDAQQSQGLVMGYCMGGTLAAMYAALRPERVAGLVCLNAPFRFSEAGRFRSFVDHVDIEEAINPEGLVPVDVMEPAFKLLDPMGNWTKYLALEKASQDPERLRRALVRERWLEENVPVAGAFAREFIREAYQRDSLLDGEWSVWGEAVELDSITCPVLNCAAQHDFIAPSASVLALQEAIPHARNELLETGHIGVVVGRFGPAHFYPLLDRWFREVAP